MSSNELMPSPSCSTMLATLSRAAWLAISATESHVTWAQTSAGNRDAGLGHGPLTALLSANLQKIVGSVRSVGIALPVE
jgi:hypothetical protein